MPIHNVRRLVGASVLLLAAAACSDDSDDASDTTTTVAEETTTTTAAVEPEGEELTAGAQIVYQGAISNGLSAATANCLAAAVYEGLTPEQRAELDAAGESGEPVPEALAGTLEQLGGSAFAGCA